MVFTSQRVSLPRGWQVNSIFPCLSLFLFPSPWNLSANAVAKRSSPLSKSCQCLWLFSLTWIFLTPKFTLREREHAANDVTMPLPASQASAARGLRVLTAACGVPLKRSPRETP